MAKSLDTSDSNNILKTILIILIVAGIAYFIYYLYTQNTTEVIKPEHRQMKQEEKYRNMQEEESHLMNIKARMTGQYNNGDPIMDKKTFNKVGTIVGDDKMEHFSQGADNASDRKNTSFPKEQLTAEELLPQDNSSLWAQVNPSGEGSLKDRNFLQSGYHIGINTVGQTLRNANLQLRSEPPCPQVVVSPWSQATITPDLGRKPFELGGCNQ